MNEFKCYQLKSDKVWQSLYHTDCRAVVLPQVLPSLSGDLRNKNGKFLAKLDQIVPKQDLILHHGAVIPNA